MESCHDVHATSADSLFRFPPTRHIISRDYSCCSAEASLFQTHSTLPWNELVCCCVTASVSAALLSFWQHVFCTRAWQ